MDVKGIMVYSGWAWKCGALHTSWKRRYFVLRKDPFTLSYYTDDKTTEPKGVIDLRKVVEIAEGSKVPTWPKTSKENARISITIPGRTYFMTIDGSDNKVWLYYLRREAPEFKIPLTAEEKKKLNASRLKDLLVVEGNKSCFDCGAPNPKWAVWNIGVCICVRCSFIHKSLGTDISKLKSMVLDEWDEDQITTMEENGNSQLKKIYEATLPGDFVRPREDDGLVKQFAVEKYVERKYFISPENMQSLTNQLSSSSLSPASPK